MLPYEGAVICLECLDGLIYHHNDPLKENALSKTFWGRFPLLYAACLLQLKIGSTNQACLHAIKYNGAKELAITLGAQLAGQLKKLSCFEQPDMLVPVPLHPSKEKKRGYNQTELIAEGLSHVLGSKVEYGLLKRVKNQASLTGMDRNQRWESLRSTFKLNHTDVEKGLHIMLVDDVITTGATIEACAIEIQEIKDVRISVAALAWTES